MRATIIAAWCVCHAAAAAPPAHRAVVYVAETSTGTVAVYASDTPTPPTAPLYTFSILPGTEQGLSVSAGGNLFLADSYTTWAYQYAPGQTRPRFGYPTAYTPQATAEVGQTLYVMEGQLDSIHADILAFRKANAQPIRVLSDSAMVVPTAMTADGAGNIIVAYADASFSTFKYGVFPHGQMPMVQLALPQNLCIAMAVDASGNLLVENPSVTELAKSDIHIFPPGSVTERREKDGLPSFSALSFTADGTSLYATPQSGQTFIKYAYPSFKMIYRVKDGHANKRFGFAGTAAAPALQAGAWWK